MAERGVSRGVAVGVVELLETVDVQEQEREMTTLPVLPRDGPGERIVEGAPVVERGQAVVIGDVTGVVDHLAGMQRGRGLVCHDGQDALGGGVEGPALPRQDERADRLLLGAQGQGEQRFRARAALVEHEDGHAVPAALQVVQEQARLVRLQQPGHPRPLEQAHLAALELVGPALRVLHDVPGLRLVRQDDGGAFVRHQLARAAEEPHADGDGIGQVGDLA